MSCCVSFLKTPPFEKVPPPPTNPIESQNLKGFRDGIVEEVVENLRNLTNAPSTQFTQIPPDLYFAYNQFRDDEVVDEARAVENQRYFDQHITHDAELYDGDKDQDLRYEFEVPPQGSTVTVETAVPAKMDTSP